MNGRELLNALEQLDDEMIKEAEKSYKQRKNQKKYSWLGLAACFCIAVGIVAVTKPLLVTTENDFAMQEESFALDNEAKSTEKSTCEMTKESKYDEAKGTNVPDMMSDVDTWETTQCYFITIVGSVVKVNTDGSFIIMVNDEMKNDYGGGEILIDGTTDGSTPAVGDSYEIYYKGQILKTQPTTLEEICSVTKQ